MNATDPAAPESTEPVFTWSEESPGPEAKRVTLSELLRDNGEDAAVCIWASAARVGDAAGFGGGAAGRVELARVS